MILIVCESSLIREIPVRNSHQTISVGEYELSVIQSEGRWHVHLPYALISEEHTLSDGKKMVLKERETQKEYSLLMFEEDHGFDTYERFRLPEETVISKNPEGIICINNGHTENGLIYLMRDGRTIHYRNCLCALNHQIIESGQTFGNGDLISMDNMRMFVMNDSVLINTCTNIRCGLKPDCGYTNGHASGYSMLVSTMALDQPIQTEMQFNLPSPDQKPFVSEERPLLYTIGPSLMMSAASLSVGILSAWRSYMAGRELIDVLPMIVLPCVMVISTLLWNPLSRHFETKKRKKETENILYAYQSILAGIQEKVRLAERAYRQETEARFPYPEKMMFLLRESTTHELHEPQTFLLRPGDRPDAFRVLADTSASPKEPMFSSLISGFMRSIHNESLQPWLIDLNEYPVIVISCGEKQNDLFFYLLIQIYWIYGIHPAFLIQDPVFLQSVWIRKYAAWEKETRMIFTSETEALRECEKTRRVLISDHPLHEKNSQVQAICKADSYSCMKADLILDPDHDLYYDRVHHINGNFTFHVTEHFAMDRTFDRVPWEGCPSDKDNGFLDMYDCIDGDSLNLEERWHHNDVNTSLKAYLGRDEQGNLITLDFNEKKDGPHGLVAGMTGSGKSELIITMLLSLAVNYSPRDVQFALIDFKGGGISQAIGSGPYALPHISGILTNLDSEEMERVLVSFHQECIRREKLIAAMNEKSQAPVMNLQDYRHNWSADMNLPYLSDLMIVIDEFAELKRERPEFLKDLISIARIGRSLGVHLILSTQKPGGSVSDEIWTNCSFKICLKVSQRQDSFEMLHNDEACSLRQSGSFLLLSNGLIQKGRAAYANMRHSLNPCHVRIHDEKGKTALDSASFTRSGPPEILSVLQSIHTCGNGYEKAYELWLNPLPERSVSDVKSGEAIYGQYDDYHHQIQPWLKLPETGSVLFITMDPEERKQMMHTLLYALLSAMNQKEELYLINDTGIETEEWRKIRMFTDSFSSAYEDKRKNVLDRILHRKQQEERIVLMIDDLSSFLASSEENSMLLQNVLEQADSRHTLIILMNGIMQKVPYRIAGLVTEKYVLRCEKPQEVQQVLECGGHHVQKKKGWGLMKKEQVMEFRYLTCSEEEIRKLAMKTIAMYGNEKTYCIPCMPEKISVHDYHGTRIPLGLKERNFTWCTIPPVETVSVVTMYPDELDRLRKILSPYSKCRYPEETDADDAQVLLMDFDTWTRERPETEALLLVGDAFRQQFVYRCRKKELRENEALFCRGHEREVIRIVEE